METDEELKRMTEIESHYERACKLHWQYETQVINARLKFQNDCPHNETKTSEYTDPLQDIEYITYHCIRCKKLIKKEKK